MKIPTEHVVMVHFFFIHKDNSYFPITQKIEIGHSISMESTEVSKQMLCLKKTNLDA